MYRNVSDKHPAEKICLSYSDSYSYFADICEECQGACCRKIGPFITEDDYQRISKAGYLGFADAHTVNGKRFYEIKFLEKEKHCFFFNPETAKCKIHEIKPLGCRVFPCLFNKNSLDYDYSCLAIRHGALTDEFLETAYSELSNIPKEFIETFNSELSKDFQMTYYGLQDQIFQASLSDLDQIMEIENLSFIDGVAETKETFRERIINNKDTFWVYKENGRVLGYYYCMSVPKDQYNEISSFQLNNVKETIHTPNESAHVLILFSVAVHPAYRGNNIGTKLASYVVGNAVLSREYSNIFFRTIFQGSDNVDFLAEKEPVVQWMKSLFNIKIKEITYDFNWSETIKTPSVLCEIIY